MNGDIAMVRHMLNPVRRYTKQTETATYRLRYTPYVRAGDQHRCRKCVRNRQRPPRQAVQHLFRQVNRIFDKPSNSADVMHFYRPRMVMLNELWVPQMFLRRWRD